MKKLIIFCSIFFSLVVNKAQVNFQWVKSIGGSINSDGGNAITTDASGNVYTTGYFVGTVDFDPGPGTTNLTSAPGMTDVFICKFNASGVLQWAVNTNCSGNASGKAIKVDVSGNVYTVGNFGGIIDLDPSAATYSLASSGGDDVFISKLNSSGVFLWGKEFGGPVNDYVRGLALDPTSANIYLTGYYSGTADFDPGVGVLSITSVSNSDDIFVSKIDASGNFVWARSMGGSNTDNGFGISIDASGNVMTTGYHGSGDFDPGIATYSLTATGADIFVSKLNASGNFVWAKSMGGSSYDYGYALITDAAGNIFTTGSFNNVVDFDPGIGTYTLITTGGFSDDDIFVEKLDANGNFVWVKQMGGPSNSDIGNSITLDAIGNVYTTGRYLYTCDFDPGPGSYTLTSIGSAACAFVSILDPSGSFVWAGGWGAAADAWGQSIVVDNAYNIYTTGMYRGTTDFDPGPSSYTLTPQGSFDIFIHKLGQSTAGIGSDIEKNKFKIYPNPCKEFFEIESDYDGFIIVFNILGEKVLEQKIQYGKNQVQVAGLNRGFYTFSISDKEKKHSTGKIVIE